MNPVLAEKWWQFARERKKLYQIISEKKITDSYPRVLVQAITSRTHGLSFQSTDQVFASALVVFPISDYARFAILQSSLHEAWAWKYSSTMKSDRSYRPSDCFENFPFPNTSEESLSALEQAGLNYHQHRQYLMDTFQVGMTQMYQCFHTPDEFWKLPFNDPEFQAGIFQLRSLKQQLDIAVLSAYKFPSKVQFDFIDHPFILQEPRKRYTLSSVELIKLLNELLLLNHRLSDDD